MQTLRVMSDNFEVLKIYININIAQSHTIRLYNYVRGGRKMFVFLWKCAAYSCITGLLISVGWSQCSVILTHIKMHIKVISCVLFQPKSVMP
jgi:hypothetical protein